MAREGGRAGWAAAARDVIVLGHGLECERRADSRALETVLSLGYDPHSILRYLDRIEERMTAGDAAVAALNTAHPAPAERRRAVQKVLAGRMGLQPSTRVNREVFRRAVGHGRLASRLRPIEGLPVGLTDKYAQARRSSGRSRLLWTMLGIGLLALTFLLVGILLSG
jgi:predicted Zn-dependent protease